MQAANDSWPTMVVVAFVQCVAATIVAQTSKPSPKPLSLAGFRRASSCHPTGTSHRVPISPSFGRTLRPASERWSSCDGTDSRKARGSDSFKIFSTTNARAEGIHDNVWSAARVQEKSGWTRAVCVNVSGLFVESVLLAMMSFARACFL